MEYPESTIKQLQFYSVLVKKLAVNELFTIFMKRYVQDHNCAKNQGRRSSDLI